MKDPIGSFDTIKENFIRYVRTAFGTKFQGVEDERYALLNQDRVFYRMPWIEPLPDYKSSGKRIDDLQSVDFGRSLSAEEIDTFRSLVKTGLFPESAYLHSHQAKMLRTALEGHNCVITSGTGSGKTESFLLPLFAQLSKELTKWPAARPKSPSCNTWWKLPSEGGLTNAQIVDNGLFNLSSAAQQRSHETRPAAVRALILYPMNALVEDQMSRLRKALDSDETREWLNSAASGNAIYFGRYNGNTPIAGELSKRDGNGLVRNSGKIERLTKALRAIDKGARLVEQHILANGITGNEAKDLKSFFPRLDGAEMRCRYDMQIAPPDILITNYSMLSIMLMRDVDSAIFEKTKAWLECEDIQDPSLRAAEKENRVFHLVIDELHLYRGTAGSEVAYLLRLVLSRLGLHPNHEQLRILASSASLEPNDPDSRKFLQDFFGIGESIRPFTIIEGENNQVSLLEDEKKLPSAPFRKIAKAYDRCNGLVQNPDFETACDEAAEELASAFALSTQENGAKKLLSLLTHPELKLRERLYAPCYEEEAGKATYKAVCSLFLEGDKTDGIYYAEGVFDFSDRKELKDALRGILIARSLLDEDEHKPIAESIQQGRVLPRFRFHYFFRNIEGMWASTEVADGVANEYADAERTCGKLYASSRITSETGKRVLELLYCDNCGTILFGGSRLVTRNGLFELLPISPNIEGIPEKTPAKLVEKRSYQEYAVFWPCGQQNFTPHDRTQGSPARTWRQTTINGNNQTDFHAEWVPASLNKISGDISHGHSKSDREPGQWVKGYLFSICREGETQDIALAAITGNNVLPQTHKALPNTCPSCGVNHQKRFNDSTKGKTTSIRGFRTGFAKTTQMFAKELMYQLPDEAEKRKLVVFSDSREDAAQIANGIERNHFTDLQREILVDELHKKLSAKSRILSAIELRNDNELSSLRNEYPDDVTEVEELIADANDSGTSLRRIQRREEAQRQVTSIRNRTFSVRELVETTNSDTLAVMVREFALRGINPGGNDISIQYRLRNNSYVPWYELIDFQNSRWMPGADPTFINELKEGNYEGLSSVFFGSLFYSLESSALGYLTINPERPEVEDNARKLGLSKNVFLDAVNGVIRILGDRYKHNKSEYRGGNSFIDYSRLPAQVKRYVQAVASHLGKQEVELGSAIYNTLIDSRLLSENHGLIIEELYIRISAADDPVWMSSRGKRPHLHYSGGVCTFSNAPLNTRTIRCETLWENNYLSYTAIKEKRKPIRLHCEELTGQTDDQFSRQRHFRNVVLPDEGNPEVQKIDLLSVTTTLEVGVDIGALQAVMLGNMPPQRFNYQQRVGRAGRRGQAYSVILTFCRGRSHDEFYFINPQKITCDAPPTPFLTMGQERICKRLLAKEVLRQAYSTITVNTNNDEEASTVHGEFGKLHNWLQYRAGIESWISSNHLAIGQIIDSLITPALQSSRSELFAWATDITIPDGLLGRAESIIANDEIATNDISEKLAEGGLLPMFGMPTTVKNLYHTIDRTLEPLSIDRPQSMAIYEFAPGAQKTKDKAIHTSIGFTTDLIKSTNLGSETLKARDKSDGLPFSLNAWFIRCRGCGYFRTYTQEQKVEEEVAGTFAQCPSCGEDGADKYQPPVMLKAPIAYRTDLSRGSDSREDSEILLSRPPIFAERTNDGTNDLQERTVNNTLLSISDKDVTWRVNTNSELFFKGSLATTYQDVPRGNRFSVTLQNQWLTSDAIAKVRNAPAQNGYSMRVRELSDEESIALASYKNTEVLRIAPVEVHSALDLNMFARSDDAAFVVARSAGVRSGYYSAAFLLQRIIADTLDIDPTEVEVADIIMKRLADDRKVAEIILTDELPNGSGFVRYLYTKFQELVDEALGTPPVGSYLGKIHDASHRNKCQDACYDCLKGYRNMSYHSLLDWRLGFSLLRTMYDANYACGADGDFNSFVELRNWQAHAKMLRDGFVESFGLRGSNEIEGIPYFKIGTPNRMNTVVVVHPFWDMLNIREENWLTRIIDQFNTQARNEGGEVRLVDTFNLHRRPGWCYEKLVKL